MNAIKDLSREISQELGEETATDSTYKDYGTSQQEGMEHQYNKYIEKRVKELLNALKEVLNKDLFTGISTEEIKEFYQATLKDYDWPEFDFNEGYQKKIMEVLGYQDKNQIGVREFIKGTVILEEKLKINKHKCQHAYENIKPKLEKCEGQLEKLNEYYKHNEKDINLGVILCEVKDLPFSPILGEKYSIELFVDNQRIVSQNSIMDDKQNIVFNQTYSFQLKNRNQELKINLIGNGITNRNLGETYINLEDISKTQETTEDIYPLYSNGKTMDKEVGKIRLSIHYVYDKVKYYEGLKNRFIRDLNGLNKMIEKLSAFDAYYSKPFGIWMIGEMGTLKNVGLKKTGEFLDQIIGYESLYGRPTYLKAKRPAAKAQLGFSTDNFQNVFENAVSDGVSGIKNVTQKNKLNLGILAIFGILSLFNNNFRYDLINVTSFGIISLMFLFEDLKSNKKYFNFIMGLIVVSEIFDLIWLITSTGSFWENKNQENNESSLKKVVYVFSWINFIIKGVLLIPL